MNTKKEIIKVVNKRRKVIQTITNFKFLISNFHRSTAEGYYDVPTNTYNYTDHLEGGASKSADEHFSERASLSRWQRLSYKKDSSNSSLLITNSDDYYPFGLKHNTAVPNNQPNYKYKYQGQEWQDELGLNWDSFKWRNYDYAIGRFMSIDPLAEKYTYNSTYAFQENKMGLGRELEGLELWVQTNGSQSTPMYYANAEVGLKNNPQAMPMTADSTRGITQDYAGNLSYTSGQTSVQLNADGTHSQNGTTYPMKDMTPTVDIKDQTLAYAPIVAIGCGVLLPYAIGGTAGATGSAIGDYALGAFIKGSIDVGLQQSIKGEVDLKQTGINAFAPTPLASFLGNTANNFGTSIYKGTGEKDLNTNILKTVTGAFTMGFGVIGNEINKEGTSIISQGFIATDVIPGVYSNSTDVIIQNSQK